MFSTIRNIINGQRSKNIHPPHLQVYDNDGSDQAVPFVSNLTVPHITTGFAQSVGMQRSHNEDSIFVLTTAFDLQPEKDITGGIPFGLYIVADGMGGHQHGEIASALATRVVAHYVVQKLLAPLLNVATTNPDESIQEILEAGLREAHQSLLDTVSGGGTTLTALLILGKQANLVHVGDSRAYRIGRDGTIDVLTRDHSWVQHLVDLGQISIEEAENHPQRNILYRALGQGELLETDFNTLSLPDSGYLLLCSDGLWGILPEKDIAYLVVTASDPQQACQRLVEAANNAGGPDNISAILIGLS